MTREPLAPSPEAWSALLGQVPTRFRGATFLRAREVALHWCALGLAGQAAALGWGEVELFGVRSWHPFRRSPLRGVALTGWPRAITGEAVHFRDGRVIRRGEFGPDFIPVWCLDRRRRLARDLVQLLCGRWATEAEPRRRQGGGQR
jgi:hypothetical protein